ncbi:MAG: acetate--CoA ligase family protein [Thermoplasmata archaeon]|nr:acetate--CoA ligase family protein [Thermoplasmata archaeon]
MMKSLFEPESIAVIGASSNPNKIGYKILDNIISSGYKGKIYPVNNKGGEIRDLKVYKDIEEIDDTVDLSIIAIPAKFVYDAVKKCAEKGVKNCIIISSGFSEVGNRKEEERIVEVARKYGMRILGPNVFGIYVAKSNLNATFGPKNVHPGHIAIITQSGALGIAMIGKSAIDHIGLSAVVSVGNKADIDEADLLEYFRNDENTKVILMYIEGFKDGERFIRALKKLPPEKHVVVIKAGRSKHGAMAAASHTGSLAGSDKVFDGIARQLGIIRAENIRDAFNLSRFLSEINMPDGEDIVIITNGGGIGVLCADACEKYDVKILDNYDVLRNAFGDIIPSFGSWKNPVDLTGQATAEDYRKALERALDNSNIHGVIALYCETAIFNQNDMVNLIKEMNEKYKNKKPIVFSLFGGEKIDKAIEELKKGGIKVFDEVYDAVAVMGAMYRRYRYAKEEIEKEELEIDSEKEIGEIIRNARKENRGVLLPHEAKRIMEIIGVSIPDYRIAKNIEEAVLYAEEIGYPVVMKIISEDIIHKTDAGGVALNLENRAEVINAYQAIIRNAKAYYPDARIRGVEISKMVPKGVETIVGATQEPTFGPTVMFGLGGIYVEAIKDVSFRAAPVSVREAKSMINEISSSSILYGIRGEKRRDIEAIVNVIVNVSNLIARVREIKDIEINPLMVYESNKGVKAVDVRILLRGLK